MGIGDWGLGIGDWGLGIGPNPQSPIPIPNPQSPICEKLKLYKNIKNSYLLEKRLINLHSINFRISNFIDIIIFKENFFIIITICLETIIKFKQITFSKNYFIKSTI